ncbi:hypothetical protein ABPG74_016269 [Tetrahymena malaccensis]
MQSQIFQKLDQNCVFAILGFLNLKQQLNLLCSCKSLYSMLQNDYTYKIICQSNYFENDNIVYEKKPDNITYKQYFQQNMQKVTNFKRIFNLLLKNQNQDTDIDYFKDLQLEKPFISDQKKVKNIISTFKLDYSRIPRDILLLYRIMNGQDEISESDQEQLLKKTFLFGKISYYNTTIAYSFTPFSQPPCGFLQEMKALPFVRIFYNQQSYKRLYIDCENFLQYGRECIYSFLSVEQNGDMYICIHDQSIQSFLENVQHANYDPEIECLDLVDTLHHPGSDTTTLGIRIRATAYFVPFDQSNSIDSFFYTYTIRISDNGVAPNKRYKLTNRNWVIKCDAQPDKEEIVSGPGVIGLYPEVFQGCEDFVYQSCCPQKGFTGSMKGSFQFRDLQTGDIITANIDEFPLRPSINQKIIKYSQNTKQIYQIYPSIS